MSLKENKGPQVSFDPTLLLRGKRPRCGVFLLDMLADAYHNLVPRGFRLQNAPFVKSEPEEARIAPLAPSASWQAAQDAKPAVKPEPIESTRLVGA